MWTPFSPKRLKISNDIHCEERDNIYPYIYPGVKKEDISYDDDEESISEEVKKYHDYEEARDCTLLIKRSGWPHAMKYTSQYRFRKAEYQRYQDISISISNNASGFPGELSKLLAVLFVYGYYITATLHLIEAIVVDCIKMRNGILDGTIEYELRPNYETDQTVMYVKFNELRKHDCILLHWKEINGKRKVLYRKYDRQVNPHVSLAEGNNHTNLGYYHDGCPRRLADKEYKRKG